MKQGRSKAGESEKRSSKKRASKKRASKAGEREARASKAREKAAREREAREKAARESKTKEESKASKARRERRRAQKELREQKKAKGLNPPTRPTASNAKCPYANLQEEREARQEAVVEQFNVLRLMLPTVLAKLKNIDDPRDAEKRKYELPMLLLYGLLMFVFQMPSRREANRKMTRPQFMENLRVLIPEIEKLPHHVTLCRLLERIDVEEIPTAHFALIRKLIKRKTFKRYLVDGCIPIAIDGTQKLSRDEIGGDDHWPTRQVKHGDGKRTQCYVYVLEASLAFRGGLVLPLMSEFLSQDELDETDTKQDCELKAFKRLAARLKAAFPRLSIMALLDGLYPNGPIIRQCRDNRWQYMIVLKDECLPTVWDEANGLRKLQTGNVRERHWGDRTQNLWWVNDIEYEYRSPGRRREVVHVVVCDETWQEVAKDSAEYETKTSRHAWISSKPLSWENLHERCNMAGRHRWTIESDILIEKCYGYSYEHCFAHDWNALKGYHYLMRLAHMLNVLVQHSESLQMIVRFLGVMPFIDFVRETIANPWLVAEEIEAHFARRRQLRLAWP